MTIEHCPQENEQCRYYDSALGCYASIHHLYWPRRDYKTSVEKEFRNLPQNKELMCRQEHDELHVTEQTPHKPKREEMLAAIAETIVRMS